MKRFIKFVLPLLAVAMLTVSCHRDCEPLPGTATLKTYYFTVNTYDWQAQERLGYVYCEKAFNELTENVLNNGAVMVYFIDQNNLDNQLPYLNPYYQELDNGEMGIFFENIRYDVRPGYITFIVQQNDCVLLAPNAPCQFKVCIFESH